MFYCWYWQFFHIKFNSTAFQEVSLNALPPNITHIPNIKFAMADRIPIGDGWKLKGFIMTTFLVLLALMNVQNRDGLALITLSCCQSTSAKVELVIRGG